MDKQDDQLRIRCAKHKQDIYQFISLVKGKCKERLLCDVCLKKNNKIDVVDLIPISIALSQPETLMEWIKKDSFSKWLKKTTYFCNINLQNAFNDQINSLVEVNESNDELKVELQKQLTVHLSLQTKLKDLRRQCFEKMRFDELCELFQQLHQQKSIIARISKMMKQNYFILFKNVILEHRNLIIDNENLKRRLNNGKLSEQFLKSLFSIRMFEVPKFKILSIEYFNIIEQKIQNDCENILTQINQIYLGSRDGLNAEQFWKKVNGKTNLLMIFQSKNIFGGYSPCKWQQNLCNYLSDDTATSFLFSQTHNQIYPLRQEMKGFAIYCFSGYGPSFGGGCDMYIAPDFISGYSNLGFGYEWNQYEWKPSEHLFGENQPNIQECEIYELIFE